MKTQQFSTGDGHHLSARAFFAAFFGFPAPTAGSSLAAPPESPAELQHALRRVPDHR